MQQNNEWMVWVIAGLIFVVGLTQALFKAWLLVHKPESWKELQEAEDRKKKEKRAAIKRAAKGSARMALWFLRR